MGRGLGYAIGSLVLGFALASTVSTAASAHGRANDGHHAREKIVSIARTVTPAERVPARQMEPRDTQRVAASAPVPASEPLPPAIASGEPSVVGEFQETASSPQLHVGVTHTRFGQPVGTAPKVLSKRTQSAAFDVVQASLSAQSGIAACCGDGRGCCCQGASVCSSCGMPCHSGAVAPVGQISAARDRSHSFHGFRSVNLDGINIGPADRPPAARI